MIPVVEWLSKSKQTIVLAESNDKLPEVIVVNKKSKEKEINFNKNPNFSTLGFSPGMEVVSLILNNKGYVGYVKSISFFVKNSYQKLYPIRVNIYSVDPITEGPKNLLYYSNVIEMKESEFLWYLINLDSIRLSFPKKGFYVGVEALPYANYKPITIEELKESTRKRNAGIYEIDSSLFYLGTDYWKTALKKGIDNYTRSSRNPERWYKVESKSAGPAVKIEIKYYSKSKSSVYELKDDDFDFVKSKKRDIKKALSIYPKYDEYKYPHGNIKEFFESNLKALINDDVLYLFAHLYLTTEADKENFLSDLESKENELSLLSKEDKEKGILFFESILNNIHKMKLNQISKNIYTLEIGIGQIVRFKIIKDKWYAYPYVEHKEISNKFY